MQRWWILLALAGCAGRRAPEPMVEVYRPPPPEATLADPADPVARALAATPQAAPPVRVAVFAVDESLAEDVAEALKGTQGVSDTYVLRGYLLDGRERTLPGYSLYWKPAPMTIDLEHLRSVVAMAGCDVLLVVSATHDEQQKVNGWIVFSPTLLPWLFMPWLNVQNTQYLDAHLIDVRTGYLYGQVTAEQQRRRGPVTLFALDRPGIALDMREMLIDRLRPEVSGLLWGHLLQRPAPAQIKR